VAYEPGVYSIAGVPQCSGSMLFIMNWGARGVFSVTPTDRAIHVGTLVVNESTNDTASKLASGVYIYRLAGAILMSMRLTSPKLTDLCGTPNSVVLVQ